MQTASIFFVVSGIVLCLLVFVDTRKHKQSMSIMGIVWPLTMLWASWIGLLAYYAFGREKQRTPEKTGAATDKGTPLDMSMDMARMPMDKDTTMDMSMDMARDKDMSMDMPMDKDMPMDMGPAKPKWQGITLSTLHCGAGCVLADIIGESLAAFLGLTLYVGWILDYTLALMIGIFFQYTAIQQMNKMKPLDAFDKALKADILSLTSWQVGMYGYMLIYLAYSGSEMNRLSFEFWYIMQFAMLTGFVLAYPMNVFLIKKGIKHAM